MAMYQGFKKVMIGMTKASCDAGGRLRTLPKATSMKTPGLLTFNRVTSFSCQKYLKEFEFHSNYRNKPEKMVPDLLESL